MPLLTSTGTENQWERQIARQAVVTAGLSPKGRNALTTELLRRLLQEKGHREEAKLNHWPAYAPQWVGKHLPRLVGARTKRVMAFLQKNRKRALLMAAAILEDPVEAYMIVSDTDLELRNGSLEEGQYYLGLKRNARNRMKRRQHQFAKVVSLEEAFSLDGDAAGEEEERAPTDSAKRPEPSSSRADELDPLEILERREDQAEFERMFKAALRHPNWRFVRRKKWARPLVRLVERCADLRGSRD